MLGRKTLAVLWIMLMPGCPVWAQDSNPKLAGQTRPQCQTQQSDLVDWIRQ